MSDTTPTKKTRTKLTPGMLRARADEMEQRQRERAEARVVRECAKAAKALGRAADAADDADWAVALRALADRATTIGAGLPE